MKAFLGEFEIRPGVYMDKEGNFYHLEIYDEYGSLFARRHYKLNKSYYRWTTTKNYSSMKEILKTLGCVYLGKL